MVGAGDCPNVGKSLWHKSYYDNLISSYEELEKICAYIRNIPTRWDMTVLAQVTTYQLGNVELLNRKPIACVASAHKEMKRPSFTIPTQMTDAFPEIPVISIFTSPQERAMLLVCLNRTFLYLGASRRTPRNVVSRFRMLHKRKSYTVDCTGAKWNRCQQTTCHFVQSLCH